MNLLVFLGNPGEKYKSNRHNIAFIFADFLRSEWNLAEFKFEKKFLAEMSKLADNIFIRPQTFMNKSGYSAQAVANYFNIPVENIFVFYDDFDQNFGQIKFKEKGGSGGQKGMQNIIDLFGTEDIKRLKFGIRNEFVTSETDTADFVLSNFSASEKEALPKIFSEAEERLKKIMSKENRH